MIPLTPLILAVALFMEQMDSTVIATSLPAIARDIGTDPISLKLAFTAYFVALAIFIPISGWMADRFGAKNVLRAAIAVFVVGSLCCAFSYSLATFVGSRALQGAGASMMTPIARLVLLRATPRNELINAMAWLTLPGMIGPMAGPPLGGFLTTYASWHWIFIINVPIGVFGIFAVTKFLPEIESRNPRPIDFRGFVLCGIAFSGIMFGLSVISLPALPVGFAYGALGAGVAAGLIYLRHAGRVKYPLLDPRILRHPVYRATIIAGSLLRISVGATPFLMPLMLQLGFGLNAFQSGLITFVGAIGAIVSKLLAERVFAAFGFRTVLAAAAGLGSVLCAANGTFFPDTPYALILLALLGTGLARSVFFTGGHALAYEDISDREAGQATALTSVGTQLSISLGVAVAGASLEFSSRLSGGVLSMADFHFAWWVVSAISALTLIPILRLPANAGSSISGHKAKGARRED